MFVVTDWTNELASCYISNVGLLGDRGSLNLLRDAPFAEGVATVKHPRDIGWDLSVGVSFGVL